MTQTTSATDDATTTAIIYARVSTTKQADSGLGLEAQIGKCRAYCEFAGLFPTLTITDAGISGSVSHTKRDGMKQALQMLADGQASTMVVYSLSRLSRSTRDALDICELARTQGWRLVVLDLGGGVVDTSTPNGEFMLTVFAGLNQLERRQTSERVTMALDVAKHQRGTRLGRDADDRSRAAGRRIRELRDSGMIWRDVCATLTSEGYATVRGGKWQISSAQRALQTVALDDYAASVRAASAA